MNIKSAIKLYTLILLSLFTLHSNLYAQYPDQQTITIVIPFAPGGTADLLTAKLAGSLESKLNTKINVVNVRGMNGSVGLMQLKEHNTDGLWLGIASTSALVGNAVVSNNRNYHPLHDFTHIAVIANVPHILMANKKLNITNFAEFTNLLKTSNSNYLFISSGYSSSGHLLFEKLHQIIGGKLSHKASISGSTTLKSLSSPENRADFLIDQLPSTISFITANKVEPLAIAVTASKRLETLPHVPTFNELGLDKANRMSMYTLIAPKGVPENIVSKLRSVLTEVLQEPNTLQFFKQNGLQQGTTDQQNIIHQIQEEYDFYLSIARENNLINYNK